MAPASLRSPAHLLLALLKLLLSEVAAQHRVAVLIDSVSEVLAGHADHAAFPVLKVALVDKIPLLYALAVQYSCTSGKVVRAATSQPEENLWHRAPTERLVEMLMLCVW